MQEHFHVMTTDFMSTVLVPDKYYGVLVKGLSEFCIYCKLVLSVKLKCQIKFVSLRPDKVVLVAVYS